MITLSDEAVNKILELCSSEEEGLKIKVVGGGCVGLQLKMNIQQKEPTDKVFEKSGAKIFVDKKSFLFLKSSEIDYKNSLQEAGFYVRNPNAKRECGCGKSFNV